MQINGGDSLTATIIIKKEGEEINRLELSQVTVASRQPRHDWPNKIIVEGYAVMTEKQELINEMRDFAKELSKKSDFHRAVADRLIRISEKLCSINLKYS